uniref:Uncharacterized protein n=1 Tax=Leersia perrieri TaxID=77586 RepID=A0A0D9WUR6_9ORYZ
MRKPGIIFPVCDLEHEIKWEKKNTVSSLPGRRVFQLTHDAGAAVPAVLRQFLADTRAAFVAYGVRSDRPNPVEHHGVELRRRWRAEEHLDRVGKIKPRRVATSRWHARRLTFSTPCVDAFLSFHLGVHLHAAAAAADDDHMRRPRRRRHAR